MRVRRDVAQNSYLDEKQRLLNEIERPPHHYYGDELEINVMSVSPSGSGVFIDDGIKMVLGMILSTWLTNKMNRINISI